MSTAMPTTPYSARLADISAPAIAELSARHRAREQALLISRQVIRHSAQQRRLERKLAAMAG